MDGKKRKALGKLPLILLILTIVLAMPIGEAYGALQVRRRYATLVFSSDFEAVTKKDANTLNLGIDNWEEFDGNPNADMWIEGLDRVTPGFTCHSESRCLGLEILSGGYRAEFNIHQLQNLVEKELFVSVWLYLPPDFSLHVPGIDWNWDQIVNPYFTGPPYLPYFSLDVIQPDITKPIFNLRFDNRDMSNKLTTIKQINNYPLPRGQWFNVQYYVLHDPVNGAIKFWINGELLFEVNGLATANPSVTEWFTTPAKIYYEPSDTFSPYRIWADDLQIYNGIP